MDKNVTLEELKQIEKKFCEERDWDQFHNPKELAIGIVTEASELLQIFRFKSNDEIKQLMDSVRKEEVEDELADVCILILRFAEMNGIDISESIIRKIKKNEQKYPVNKSKGSNKKYSEL